MFYRTIIRAVPERAEYVRYLTDRIPDAEVHWDAAQRPMGHWLDTLRDAGDEPTIQMEDDVILTTDFAVKVRAALTDCHPGCTDGYPRHVTNMFSMRQADLTEGSRWTGKFLMMQCFYLPPGYGPAIADWHDTHWQPRNELEARVGIDVLVGDYLRSRDEPTWLHVPSLVQHRTIQSATFLHPGKRRTTPGRTSPSFVDPWE